MMIINKTPDDSLIQIIANIAKIIPKKVGFGDFTKNQQDIKWKIKKKQ